MNYRLCLSSFEVEHGVNSPKVRDVHEVRAGKMSDVIGEGNAFTKDHTYVTDRRIGIECVDGCRVNLETERSGIFLSYSLSPFARSQRQFVVGRTRTNL